MKANGRRRWRKWAKRCRKQRCGEASLYSHDRTNKTRRHYGRLMTTLWALPPVFGPRSLVGMTMGARKRAARACPGCIECLNEIPSIDHGVRCDSSGTFAAAPARLRTKYRIGQRLRPCPGCLACVACGWESDFFLSLNPCCDGSGVLPARSRVNRGKPLAVEPADDLG